MKSSKKKKKSGLQLRLYKLQDLSELLIVHWILYGFESGLHQPRMPNAQGHFVKEHLKGLMLLEPTLGNTDNAFGRQ